MDSYMYHPENEHFKMHTIWCKYEDVQGLKQENSDLHWALDKVKRENERLRKENEALKQAVMSATKTAMEGGI